MSDALFTELLGAANIGDWTYLRVNADVVNSTTTPADVLTFTPEPNAQYVIEGLLLVRSATGGGAAGVAPQPCITWPTNVGDGVYYVQQAGSSSSTVPRYGNTSANFTSGVADIIDNTGSWPVFMCCTFITPANVSGDWKLQVRSESAGTAVTVRAGSYLRYRRIL